MTKIIVLAEHIAKIDENTEPCSNCDDQPNCHDTCERARIWWDNFAKQFGGSHGGKA